MNQQRCGILPRDFPESTSSHRCVEAKELTTQENRMEIEVVAGSGGN
jgi:hypothetical protein